MASFRHHPQTVLVLITISTLGFCTGAHGQFAGGTGEPNDPYQIATAEQLVALGQDPSLYDRHFVLVADLDLDPNLPGARVFDKAVIAPDLDVKSGFQGQAFTGSFNGREHTISGLTIVTNTQYAGLFGAAQSTAHIQNLTLEHVSITSTAKYEYNKPYRVGGLVGENRGLVEACHSTGTMYGTVDVGGLVGANYGTVIRCSSTATVHGSQTVGGLVGGSSGRIVSCCAKGNVTGASDVGGLMGMGSATASYSTAVVSGYDFVGGLVGETGGILLRCFSAGPVIAKRYFGGMVGAMRRPPGMGRAVSCIFDNVASGQRWDYQAVGLSTEEMRDPNILALNGWAHDPNWVLDSGRDYPRLAWERNPGRPIPEPNLNWLQGTGTAEDPYILDSAEQIVLLSKASLLWDHDFAVDADIDLDPNLPGRCTFHQPVIIDFRRIFDGGGHVIRNLTIIGGTDVGLFGRVRPEGEIRNISLQDAVIEGAEGGYCVGALAGENAGSVSACHATVVARGDDDVGGLIGANTGSVLACSCAGSVSGAWYVGGLVAGNSGSISASSSAGSVSASNSVGGLVGDNAGGVTRCCARGVDASGDNAVGGFVGANRFRTGIIEACYATGAVQGISNVGGFAGWNGGRPPVVRSIMVQAALTPPIPYGTIRQCYTACSVTGQQQAGGFVGYVAASADPVQESCFFLTLADGAGTDNGFGTALTAEQMRQQTTFVDWDFENVWTICEGKDYPRLRWEGIECEGEH